MPTPISLQMYTVRDLLKNDYWGTLKQIADIGYVAIEGGPPAGTAAAEFKKVLADYGMHISSNWTWPTAENVMDVAAKAKDYGFKFYTNGFNADQLKTPEQIKQAGERLASSAKLLGEHDLTFCVHNHAWEFDKLDGELVYDLLMGAAGPAVNAELDIYWASNFGTIDVSAVVSKYKSRIPLLHVKDGSLKQGDAMTAVGSGKLDVAACIKAADPNVLKYLVVELDHYVGGSEHVMDAVRDSYQWLVKSGLGVGRK